MIAFVGLLALSSTDVQGQGTIIGAGVFGPAQGISGNIVFGANNHGQAVLYNDISQTSVVLNVPSNSYASGMAGNYIVGSYAGNSGNENGFVYNIMTGTYITLDDPSAPGGTSLVGIYGDNIIDSDGGIYNITNQTWTFSGGPSPTGIYGNYIVGSIETSSSPVIYDGYIYNGATLSTFSVPGSTITLANGIFGTEVVGSSAGGPTPYGYVYNYATGTYTFPVSLSNFSNIALGFSFTGISGSSLLGVEQYYNLRGQEQSTYFVYTVPEISSIWLVAVPFIGFLYCRFRPAVNPS